MSSEHEVKPGALAVCGTCPWRASNIEGEPLFDDVYTREHLVRCWRDVVNGNLTVCHLTAGLEQVPPEAHATWLAAGREPQGNPRECAGSVAAALREVHRLLDAGDYDAYARAWPNGLRPETAHVWLQRLAGAAGAGWPELRPPRIDPGDVTDPATFEEADWLKLMSPDRLARLLTNLQKLASGDKGQPT